MKKELPPITEDTSKDHALSYEGSLRQMREDYHYNEELHFSKLDANQVEDMHTQNMLTFAEGCTFCSLNGQSGPLMPPTKIQGIFRAEALTYNLEFTQEGPNYLTARSKDGTTFEFRK